MNKAEIKAKVEEIEGYEVDTWEAADRDDHGWSSTLQDQMTRLINELEASGITLEETGDEIYTVLKDGKPYLVFNKAEWAWKTHSGKWPWEKVDYYWGKNKYGYHIAFVDPGLKQMMYDLEVHLQVRNEEDGRYRTITQDGGEVSVTYRLVTLEAAQKIAEDKLHDMLKPEVMPYFG